MGAGEVAAEPGLVSPAPIDQNEQAAPLESYEEF
jgi:hypothetical protein